MDINQIRLSLPAEFFSNLLATFAANGCDTEEAAKVAVHALLIRHAQRRGLPLTPALLQSGALLDVFIHDEKERISKTGAGAASNAALADDGSNSSRALDNFDRS